MKRMLLLIIANLSVTAGAGVVLQAESVTVNQLLYSELYSVNNIINQDNLSQKYISGETDFDSYMALNPTDGNDAFNSLSFATPTVDIDLDLGGLFIIESMALWNRGLMQQGVKEFNLYASDDPSFTDTTLLGQFSAAEVLGSSNFTAAEVFSFAPTSARYIRMSVLSSYSNSFASLNEVAFEAYPVPEPGSLALLVFGGMIAVKRRDTKL